MRLVAEIGQAHDGSLGVAHAYIDALANTGVDTIKWQTHIAEAESSPFEEFRIKFSYQDKTRFDYWKRISFTENQWVEIRQHCSDVGLTFMSSPFSNMAVDLLERVGVSEYKIGSGEVTNFLMLEKIAKTGKPVVLSTGMSSYEELDSAVDFLNSFGIQISILQCTTSYPTQPDQWGLNVIQELKERYKVSVGFSDHSGDIFAGLAAVTLGADILEFHVTFDKRSFGPDSTSSLTLDQVVQLSGGAKRIKEALQNPVDKQNNNQFRDLKMMFEKSLAVNRNIKKGEELTFDNLEAKKPSGKGIPASRFREILGKRLLRDLEQYSFIHESDLEDD